MGKECAPAAARPWMLGSPDTTLDAMSDMADRWLVQFSAALGVDPPTPQETEDLLRLAGIAARSSERIAAPVSTWLAAKSQLVPAEALEVAERLASAFNVREDE